MKRYSFALMGLLALAPITGKAASIIVGGASFHIGVSEYTHKGETKALNQLLQNKRCSNQGLAVAYRR